MDTQFSNKPSFRVEHGPKLSSMITGSQILPLYWIPC
jgi:hypothetical protein